MKPKQLTIWVIILSAIFVIGLAITWGYFTGRMRANEEQDKEQQLILQAHDKQIPYIAKYTKLVKELQLASKGSLTAFEIVEISRIIITQCQLNQDIQLSPSIIMAIMERESAFNPKAVSKKKAYGLMQLIRTTMQDHLDDLGYGQFAVELALNPVINVECGIREIIKLRKYWLTEGLDDWILTYSSYFWGIRYTWELLTSKKRAKLPSLEYGKGISDLARKWKERGIL